MLPHLQTTDILSHTPDAEIEDIWDPTQRRSASYTQLSGPGVYCFYDLDTQEVLYVGSSACRHALPWSSGLRARLANYYLWKPSHRKNGSPNNVNKARLQGRRIGTRCWLTACAADAFKYEHDAIEKHQPPLNVHARRPIAKESDVKAKMNSSRLRLAAIRKRTVSAIYEHEDLGALKFCSKCETSKPRSEYSKASTQRDGRSRWCKECMRYYQNNWQPSPDAMSARQRRLHDLKEANRDRYTPEESQLLKQCPRCLATKRHHEFGVQRTKPDGRDVYCKQCIRLYKRDYNAKTKKLISSRQR